jgi:hypothetical protein
MNTKGAPVNLPLTVDGDLDIAALLEFHRAQFGDAVMTMTATEQPVQVMQGIMVPASAVNPDAFFAHTRRLTFPMIANRNIAGLGSSDLFTATQTGIISQLSVKLSASLVITTPTGAVATTAKWPYDIMRALRFTANGQSNLVNCPGIWLKAREFATRPMLTDRGLPSGIGGASPGTTTTTGALRLSTEIWGVGQNVTAITAGTYSVELQFVVPVAFDERTLVGAIFAQTASTELSLNIDWAPPTDLFVITGTSTVTLTPATVTVEGIVYSIPEVGGQIIVPNLSAFHSFIVSRYTAVANGDNEYPLPGQGVGRQLMRVGFKTLNGAAPGTPLPLNAVNYGQVGWRYGGNDTPEVFTDGRHLAQWNERIFGVDFAQFQGIGWLDFCSDFALRDSIDEGLATNLRLLYNIPTGVTLTSAATEVVQETIFGAAAGA